MYYENYLRSPSNQNSTWGTRETKSFDIEKGVQATHMLQVTGSRRMASCSYLYVVGVELVARQGVERAEVLASWEDTVTSTASVAANKTTRMGLQSKRNAQTVYLWLQTNPNMISPCLIQRKLFAYIDYEEVWPCIFLYSIRQYSIQRKTQAFRVLARVRAFITHTSGVTVMRPLTWTGNLTLKSPN